MSVVLPDSGSFQRILMPSPEAPKEVFTYRLTGLSGGEFPRSTKSVFKRYGLPLHWLVFGQWFIDPHFPLVSDQTLLIVRSVGTAGRERIGTKESGKWPAVHLGIGLAKICALPKSGRGIPWRDLQFGATPGPHLHDNTSSWWILQLQVLDEDRPRRRNHCAKGAEVSVAAEGACSARTQPLLNGSPLEGSFANKNELLVCS